MRRRDVLKSALVGAAALAAPRIVRAEGQKTITFVPHADLASLDPVWTTADVTRNFSLAVYDTLYGFDAEFTVQPQMVAGDSVSSDGKEWTLTLRDGLKIPRRDPGPGARLRRDDQALGAARRDGHDSDGPHRRD